MDLIESIRSYLIADTTLADVQIGEVIPQGTNFPYVFLIKSGEQLGEELSNQTQIESVTVDVEVCSKYINQCRLLTAAVKKRIRTYTLHSISFTDDYDASRSIHGMMIEDHDDKYVPQALDSDDDVHIGALNLTVLFGEFLVTEEEE
jgi:hypothetical protein